MALVAAAKVLDAGCGRTTRLRHYRDRIAELTGADLDADGGRENRSLDRFVVADLCRRLPFEDGVFDLVYANFVVEHLSSPEVAFDEWRRVLVLGGALIVVTSNRANPLLAVAGLLPGRARIMLKRRGAGAVGRDVFPTLYRANTPEQLASLGLFRNRDARPLLPGTERLSLATLERMRRRPVEAPATQQ